MLAVAPQVAEAIAGRRPVVALETTLVTHGLPHPEGLAVAAELEAAVRESGALPATIGVLDGRVVVGLDGAQLERLATTPGVAKLNPGNLAARLAAGGSGSTTVAGTILAARLGGIEVMATGGIGGVHRDVGATGDVSADLVTLARTPVAVVCSGAKAILDLPRTREALETLGVPVWGFGTDELPAFYRRDSGLPVDHRFDSVAEVAKAFVAHCALGSGTGVVVGNPVAVEHELPLALYDRVIGQALADAERQNVRGRAVTPFLLDRLRALSEGASVFSNRALLVGNARLAGRLAVALSAVGGRHAPGEGFDTL
jgi:pseudouridine-5'-phosphate glycosidase